MITKINIRQAPAWKPDVYKRQYKRIPAAHLVKGDVVQLKAGNQVPADIRLLSVQGLSVNESALTGESLPVSKTAAVMPKNLTAADRRRISAGT